MIVEIVTRLVEGTMSGAIKWSKEVNKSKDNICYRAKVAGEALTLEEYSDGDSILYLGTLRLLHSRDQRVLEEYLLNPVSSLLALIKSDGPDPDIVYTPRTIEEYLGDLRISLAPSDDTSRHTQEAPDV